MPARRKAAQPDPVFAAIEAHREAWAVMDAETHWFYGKGRSRRRRCPQEYKAAGDAYDAHTSAFVLTTITTLEGLQAFTDYLAGLQAYGRRAINLGPYAVDVIHLSDAMTTVSEAMRRLSSARPARVRRVSAQPLCRAPLH